MSSLIVEVCDIKDIVPHELADSLEVAIIKEWECIVKKGKYKVGDPVVYIPIDSILPEELIDKLNVRSYLKGHKRNRVGCARIRSRMSYGLIIDNDNNFPIGTDVSKYYGIEKYYPPVNTYIGDASADDIYFPKLSEIENIKNFPDTFSEGQLVVATEKIDGTQGKIGVSRVDFEIEDERSLGAEIYKIGEQDGEDIYAIWKAASNGLMRKRPLVEEYEMKKNIYWFPFTLDPIYDFVEHLIFDEKIKSVQLFGEIVGEKVKSGVKSLNYGIKSGLSYFLFGIKINGKKVSYKQFKEYCIAFNLPMVPEIAILPYNYEEICKLSQGKSVLASMNGADHIREGVVVTPYDDVRESIAKFLNPEYLLLKESGKIEDSFDI